VRAWFPFYAADWLADEDVDLMPLETQGAYVRLMCHQWREGSIPADTASIARLLRVHHKTFSVIWSKLETKFPLSETGQRRLNTRLKNVQDQQALKSRRQANNAAKRWESQETDHAMAMPRQCDGNAIQNQSQSQNTDLSLARVPAALTPHVLGLMFDQETGRPNSGNLTALSSLVDRIRKHRELSKAERTEVEHAAAFVAGFKAIVGQWKAAGKPAPSLTVEKFDEHFAHVCDWVEGKFRVASTSTQQPAAPRRRNDLTALATGKVRES
jgi:uncharacterized protein YdaU (DUF1376 family)